MSHHPCHWPARSWRLPVGTLAWLALVGAQAQGIDLAALLRRADPDSLCAQTQLIGQCRCAGIVCGVRVRRYVPVAFIETTVKPGDTLLGMPSIQVPGLGGTVSSALSTTDNTAEAHVWRLPNALSASASGLPCLSCSASNAAVPVAGAADPAAAVCGPAGAVTQAVQAASGPVAAAIPLLPVLSYASELDWLNWRTGCRDLFEFASGRAAPALACGVPGAGTASSASTDASCIGAWGPMRPRQMRDIGPNPVLYSAKTAVRAMSIAREQLGDFPFPVDTQGKLQQVYPAVSACFGVGQLPLPALPPAARPVTASPDGRYGWIYWRPAVCCVGLSSAAQCLRGAVPRP